MTNKIIPLKSRVSKATLVKPVVAFSKAKFLAQMYSTPFLVLSANQIEHNIRTLKMQLPGVKLYYAMKSNPDLALLSLMADKIDGIDVASFGELAIAKQAGITPDRVIHSNPIKRVSDIKKCVKEGVNWFTFDNMFEIPKMQSIASNSNLLLRIAIKNENCIVNLSSKFGAQEEDVLPLLNKARSVGLNVRGLAFHVGSQCTEPATYTQALIYARRIFDKAITAGFSFDTLDIGGGFPISYRTPLPSLSEFCSFVSKSLRELFPKDLNFFAEPGRCISGDPITLVTRVIGRSLRNGVPWYYIDDGVYGAFSGKLFDKCDYRIVSEHPEQLEKCVVAGPTCDSIDVVSTDQKLPKLDVGDILLVPGMGAYTSASATSFNGFSLPKIITEPDDQGFYGDRTSDNLCNTIYEDKYSVKEA